MQAKFTYSPTGKVLVKQTNKKKIKLKNKEKKQVGALEVLKPEENQ